MRSDDPVVPAQLLEADTETMKGTFSLLDSVCAKVAGEVQGKIACLASLACLNRSSMTLLFQRHFTRAQAPQPGPKPIQSVIEVKQQEGLIQGHRILPARIRDGAPRLPHVGTCMPHMKDLALLGSPDPRLKVCGKVHLHPAVFG